MNERTTASGNGTSLSIGAQLGDHGRDAALQVTLQNFFLSRDIVYWEILDM
jgi:hypothetical protein